MNKKIKYDITCRVTMLQKGGQAVLNQLSLGIIPEGKIDFEFKESGNQLICNLDGNAIGAVNSVLKEGTAVKLDAILEAMKGKWEARITSASQTPKCFNVEFIEEEVNKTEIKVKAGNYDSLIKKIVSEGICTEEELRERIAYMENESKMPEELIKEVLNTYKKYDRPIKKPNTLFHDRVNENGITNIAECVGAALIGRACIYEGDKSVGKNVASETLAWILGLPYYVITFNRMMTQEDIYGSKSTKKNELSEMTNEEALEIAKTNKTLFDIICAKAASVQIEQEISQFTAWLKDGGLLVLNEMNMADSNFFGSFINPVTDGTRFLDIPGIGRVYVNENCVLVGNQNKGYTGEMEQNSATISRFGCIKFDYPKTVKPILKAAAKKAAEKKLDDLYYEQADKFYQKIFAAVQKGQSVTNTALNIRGFVAALDTVSIFPGFYKLSSALEINVINTCPEDDRAVLLTTLKDTITL